ncbi:MAG TPA: hypothetical protein VM925_16075 [Labilithrix sp.]|nr:hypothetical protein [Labilithrix sp.]
MNARKRPPGGMKGYTRIAALGAALAAVGLAACNASQSSGDQNGDNAGAGGPSNGTGANATGQSGAGKAGATLPLVKPPVQQSAPAGFGGTPAGAAQTQNLDFQVRGGPVGLDSSDIKSRFFGAGPTNIFRVLDDIDGRIQGINARLNDGADCSKQAPVAYSLTPWGHEETFYAQCYETFGESSSFMQFGTKDGVTYVYTMIGAGPVAARITPIVASNADGGTDGGADADIDGATEDGGGAAKYSVHAWIAIADGKKTGGSYGVIEIDANPSTHSFEMAVAGIGFGYCGAQVKANADSVYVEGSSDMGSTCNDIATSCVAASDITTKSTCEPPLTAFALAPLGRKATTNATGTVSASQYPGGEANVVNLDGSETDSTAFGPTSPTEGVGAFGTTSGKADPDAGEPDAK